MSELGSASTPLSRSLRRAVEADARKKAHGKQCTSSIGCMSTDCVDRSAPDLCPNMSASFSMATGATRASTSPIQVERIGCPRHATTLCGARLVHAAGPRHFELATAPDQRTEVRRAAASRRRIGRLRMAAGGGPSGKAGGGLRGRPACLERPRLGRPGGGSATRRDGRGWRRRALRCPHMKVANTGRFAHGTVANANRRFMDC